MNDHVTHTQNLTMEQETAIALATDMKERIIGVTGAAGTGKTLVLGKAYREMKREFPNEQIALCAPTGRAAKRIQELTGIKATTIHKLLEFPTPDDPVDMTEKGRPEEDEETRHMQVATDHEPRRCRAFPLMQRIVFVDEASMIGPVLYRQLVDALPARGCIRFFGDNNQLPPIEEGIPPFIEILETKPSQVLTFNFRSEDEIVMNANRILQGRVPQRNSRFEIIYTNDPIRELIATAGEHFRQMDHQIIMPTRRGKVGTARVNTSLQLRLNPHGEMLRLDRFDKAEAQLLVRAADKFLWIKNDYNLKLFNGEIGTIDWLNAEDGSIGLATYEQHVTVPARVKTYSPYLRTVINYDPRKQIELGYAITTHKAQGSEFDTVFYCMTGYQYSMLNRNNFYTGITRAKNKVVVVTDRRAMGLSLRKGMRY